MSVPHQTGTEPLNVVLQWNAHGLRSKLSEIELLASRLKPCVMALQETMTKVADIPPDFLERRYKWYIRPHKNACIHGTGLAVREDIPHRVVQLDTDLEANAVTIQYPSKLTIVSLYMAPRNKDGYEGDLVGKLDDLIKQLPTPFVIVGDFNAHHPSWGSHRGDHRGERLVRLFGTLGCTVLNDGRPTRIDITRGIETAIDLAIASWDVSCQFIWQIDDDLHGSDHLPITLSQAVGTPPTVTRPRWIFERADWEGFRKEVSTKMPNDSSVLSPAAWTLILSKAAHHHIPQTGGRAGLKSVPWWSTEVHVAIKRTRKLLRALRRLKRSDPSRGDKLKEFQLARLNSRKLVRVSKRKALGEFSTGISETTGSAELWRKVKSVSNMPKHAERTIKIDGRYSKDPGLIAEAFANQFASVSADSNHSQQFLDRKTAAELDFAGSPTERSAPNEGYNRDFDLNELNWALRRGNGKAAGLDGISYPMLRNLPTTARCDLLDTLNGIWDTSQIPDEWKEGLVIPIPKPGKDTTLTEGYRPIALLSCMEKTHERMVERRLLTEIERRGLLDPRQHGFVRGGGSETFFLETDRLLDKASSENLHVDVVSLDLSKAYDMTWRLPILTTLKRWGIKGRMYNYVENFLQNRRFRVWNAGAISSPRLQENGIPQGSVLSVTLFIIAMNSVFGSIPQGIHIIVYADDITLIIHGKYAAVVRRHMQNAVQNVVDWADGVGFTISIEKSKLMHVCFGHTHRPALHAVSIGEHTIKTVREMDLLGVTIDSKLTFNKHANKVKENLIPKLNVLRALTGRFSEASRCTLIKVAKAFIVPSILYGAELWSRGGKNLLKILGPQYNEALRICSGAFKSSPIDSLMVESGQLPLLHLITEDLARKGMRAITRAPILNINSPMVVRAEGWWNDLTDESFPTLCPQPRLSQRAWDVSPPRIDWRVKTMCGSGANTAVAQAIFCYVAESYGAGWQRLYTDGSLVNEGVGYGVYGEAISRCGRLPDLCGIFSAEAYALLQACKLADNGLKTVVFSDSASCLSALEHGRVAHPWLLEIQQRYANITFVWIPGHAGIQGNEAADRLANQGRAAPREEIPVPLRDAARWAKRFSRQVWDTTWFYNRDAFLRRIKMDTQEWKDVPNSRDQRVLTRLRIGHTRLTHGPRFSRSTTNVTCPRCDWELDVTHLLVECPARAQLRSDMGVEGSIREVLFNDRGTEYSVLKYLRIDGLYDSI